MELSYIDLKYRPKSDDLIAEYYVEPNNCSIEYAAENLAGESSIGTWTNIGTLSPEIAKRLKPHIFSIDKKKSLVKIAYPDELFEPSNMPQIWSAVAGNIFGMNIVKNLRLLDIRFPKSLLKSFKGPKFGIDGIRKLTGVKKRPLVGTIIKPKVGLDEVNHAKVAYQAWVGGCDIVKDDENLTSMNFNHFQKRVVETVKMKQRAEAETGEKKIYMPNITAESSEMIKRMQFVKESGNEYVMLDILTCGLSGLQTVRDYNEDFKLVIHAHRAMHAALTRNPKHGISMLTIAKCARLIGVDQLHIGTGVGKMSGEFDEIAEIENELEHDYINAHKHLSQRWENIKPVFAVCSGGLHPGMVPPIIKNLGNNIIIQMGGGIHGHPDGTIAGATAARQAIDAVMEGVPLFKYAEKHQELHRALHLWGIVKK